MKSLMAWTLSKKSKAMVYYNINTILLNRRLILISILGSQSGSTKAKIAIAKSGIVE